MPGTASTASPAARTSPPPTSAKPRTNPGPVWSEPDSSEPDSSEPDSSEPDSSELVSSAGLPPMVCLIVETTISLATNPAASAPDSSGAPNPAGTNTGVVMPAAAPNRLSCWATSPNRASPRTGTANSTHTTIAASRMTEPALRTNAADRCRVWDQTVRADALRYRGSSSTNGARSEPRMRVCRNTRPTRKTTAMLVRYSAKTTNPASTTRSA